MEISLSNCLACAGRNSRRMEISFLELALEGERMCKAGDFRSGVSVFQAAMDVGTEDLQILSAVYSQLGNAYFHLGDYSKALEFHGYDVTLTRAIGDKPGEAKASGNLGNTLKALGRFEEAIECCQRHLDISRDLNDKVGQARALYNCGNVYHAKGRSLCRSGGNPDEFSEEAITALQKAVEFYEANMSMVKETGDRAAQGRAHGNLGNTHYMLGNFGNAIVAHEQRLIIAKEFGDKAAERRAFCNLGNSFIFLGEFEVAAGHYKRSLELARQLKDQAVEAQACYSLGNTYTLLQDYERAIDYHLKHLIIAQDLNDRIGVGRACWSLSNAHTALGNHEQALHFSEKHLEICKETGDHSSELIARTNISDLQVVLGLSLGGRNPEEMENQEVNNSLDGGITHVGRRHSMENLELVKLSPEKKSSVSAQEQKEDPGKKTKQRKPSLTKMSSRLSFIGFLRSRKNKDSTSLQALPISTSCQNIGMNMKNPQRKPSSDRLADEGFFDLLSRFQSNRINDQRCSIQDSRNQLSASCTPISTSHGTIKKSLSMSVSSPHIRRNIHRASAVSLPGLRTEQESQQSVLNHLMASCEASDLTDNFLDTLVKCQGSNLDDQRCAGSTSKGPTVPDEDFLSLIMRYQAKRMGAQRFSCNTTHPNRTCSETS